FCTWGPLGGRVDGLCPIECVERRGSGRQDGNGSLADQPGVLHHVDPDGRDQLYLDHPEYAHQGDGHEQGATENLGALVHRYHGVAVIPGAIVLFHPAAFRPQRGDEFLPLQYFPDRDEQGVAEHGGKRDTLSAPVLVPWPPGSLYRDLSRLWDGLGDHQRQLEKTDLWL